MRTVVALAVVAAAACGPSNREIRRARASEYQTEFARVWNAAVQVVTEEYPRLVMEDAVNGLLQTDWHLIEKVKSDDVSDQGQTTSTAAAPGTGMLPYGGRFFHLKVKIRGGPPWRVEVEGEAAEYKPGLAMIIPFKRGAIDEPGWVQARIDKVVVKIHQRLAPYAVVRQAPAAKKPVPDGLDTSAWANLPDDAAVLIARVAAAADARDAAAVRAHMAEAFTWSLGGTPSAETAVTMWSADPSLLDTLAKLLKSGCRYDQGAGLVACPRSLASTTAWRAEFRLAGGVWRFTAYYQGE